MNLRDVVKEYFVVRRKAFKSTTIQQAWRKSGLCPINPDVFTPSDFAPSHSSSTVSHAPLSFPLRMPHVPDASSDDGMFDPSLFQPVVDRDGNSSSLDTEYHCSDSESSTESENSEVESPSHLAEEMVYAHGISTDQELEDLDDLVDDSEEENTPCPQLQVRKQHYSPLHPLNFSTPTLKSISSSSPCNGPRYTRSRVSQTPLTGSSEIDRDEEIRALRKQLENTQAQRDAAEVHAVMAQREAAVWKFRFNQKKEKAAEPSHHRLHTSSLTTKGWPRRMRIESGSRKRSERNQRKIPKKLQKRRRILYDAQLKAQLGYFQVHSPQKTKLT